MIIHTKNVIKNTELNFLNEGQNLLEILKVKDKIIISLDKIIKTTKQIEMELNIKPRTTRKALFDLEKEGLVKRIKNEKFRHSNSWRLRKKQKLSKQVPKNKICIFYKTPHGNNAYKTHYLIIPSKIPLNKDDLSALGFFQAEGSKKRKATEVVNSELNLIKLFINFLKNFDIKKKNLSFRVIFNKKLISNLKLKKRYLEKNSKIYWGRIANMKKHNYRKFNYTGTFKGKLRKQSPIHGSLSIEYCNTVFREFLRGLLNEVKNKLTDKEDIIAYLGGFLAGEAYVGKYDREIQIASIDLKELYFVKELLKKLEIPCSISKKTSTSPPRIIITNLKSFLILKNADIFKFHYLKKRNLLMKILNYKLIGDNLRKELEKKLTKIKKLIELREIT